MFSVFEHFFLRPPQFQIFLSILATLGLAILIGRQLRRSFIEAAAIGLLTLCGTTNITLIVSMGLGLPTWSFGFLTAAISGAVIMVLRRFVMVSEGTRDSIGWFFVLTVSPPVAAFYLVNIIQPDPSADLASLQAWPVLYIQEAFSRDMFFDVASSNFSNGHMASLNYYLDLYGAIALARWFGLEAPYPAYHGVSTLASILGFVLLAFGLRKHKLALICFSLLTLIVLRTDGIYRLFLGYNWFEVIIYLGGAQIIYYLAKGNGRRDAIVMAATVGIFLVFSRHYGAFFGALILISGAILDMKHLDRGGSGGRPAARWLALGVMLTLFTMRDLYYLFEHPSPFYPGVSQLDTRAMPTSVALFGTLNDIGLLSQSEWPPTGIGWRSLYIILLALLFWHHRSKIARWPRRVVVYLAPFAVFALPFLLQTVSGYRTGPHFSKVFALGIFLPSWYACYAIEKLIPPPILTSMWEKSRRLLIAGMLAVMVTVVSIVVERLKTHPLITRDTNEYLSWAFQTYRDWNHDLNVAKKLKATYGDHSDTIRDRPIVYFHYEPGISLRLFLGGKFFQDFDFWSDTVAKHFPASKNLEDLILRLGSPNIYLSLGASITYGSYFNNGWRKFSKDLQNLEQLPWIERVVTYKSARFFVVRKPEH
ncbi:MAG: hypothetical protein CMF67_10485 [Magnetovibrio sp.]|nr:hypothetical protein [Magnetovibrio sp.]